MNFNELMVQVIDRIMEWGNTDDLAALPDDDFMNPQPGSGIVSSTFARRFSMSVVIYLLDRTYRPCPGIQGDSLAARPRANCAYDVGVTLVRMAGYRNRLVHFTTK